MLKIEKYEALTQEQLDAQETKVIAFSIQKGGASKSTTTAVTSHLIPKLQPNAKVLVIDFDAQGNQTQLLTGLLPNEFNATILDAMKAVHENPNLTGEDIKEYFIHEVNENLHIIPANDLFATFWQWLYLNVYPTGHDINTVLKEVIDRVKHLYNYIIIDTAPDLSERMTNALVAATDVVIMFEPSKFCFDAVPRLVETINAVRDAYNPYLRIAGIAASIQDGRRWDNNGYVDMLKQTYGEAVFENIIQRKAETGRLSLGGFGPDNKELSKALAPYKYWIRELLNRLQ
jgi:chromosome partitioning protein